MHPDAEYKYKEKLELEIEKKLNEVFGPDVKDYQFVDHSTEGRPAPIYNFQYYLTNYRQYLQIRVIGTDFGVKWGEVDSDPHLRRPLYLYSPETLQEVLEEVKTYLDQHLTYTDIIFLDPLTTYSADVKFHEIQGLIKEIFQEQVSFGQRQYDLKGDHVKSASFVADLEDYQTTFTIELKGQQFSLTLNVPFTPSLEQNLYFLGYPQDLTDLHLRELLRQVKSYLDYTAKQRQKEEPVQRKKTPAVSNEQEVHGQKERQPHPKDDQVQDKTREEQIAEISQQKSDRERYLGLQKLWKLQFLIFIILFIIALVVEIYMGSAGYESFNVSIRHVSLPAHSYVMLLTFLYVFLTLFVSNRKIRGFLQTYPSWCGLPTKGVAFPTGGLVWTLTVAMLVVMFGTIDVTSRKPQPKIDINETYRVQRIIQEEMEKERSSNVSRLLENLRSTAQSEESSASLSE